MNILSEISKAGLVLSLAGTQIKVSNPEMLTDDLRISLRLNKPEIYKHLSGAQLQQDIREQIEERAAIMEYDGGLTRKDAEQAAKSAIRVYCYRITDKPESELFVIMPNTKLEEAREILSNKYSKRLIEVYASPYLSQQRISASPLNTARHW